MTVVRTPTRQTRSSNQRSATSVTFLRLVGIALHRIRHAYVFTIINQGAQNMVSLHSASVSKEAKKFRQVTHLSTFTTCPNSHLCLAAISSRRRLEGSDPADVKESKD